MLFLAVFCGFLAENIREHRVEHLRAKEYASMLKEDLVNDTTDLNFFINIKDSMKNVYDRKINFFDTPIDKITFEQVDSMDKLGIELAPFISNDATSSLLKSSGNLRYFKDTALLKRIAKYDVALKRLKEFWTLVNSFYGGLTSEHMLKSEISMENFRKSHPNEPPNRSIKEAGYKFESWYEANTIIRHLMESMSLVYADFYPDIKKLATEIILLLNKNYHLK